MRLLIKTLHHLSKLHRTNLNLHKHNASTWTLHRLKSRGLLKLTGSDVVPYLQGLVTNDVTVLHGCPSMYSMLLNVQGRVLYDLILYNSGSDVKAEDYGILVEHDRSITQELTKILKRYKIRRKVALSDISEESQVFAALPVSRTESNEPSLSLEQKNLINIAEDPRLNVFGTRILAQSEDQILQSVCGDTELLPSTEESYHECRYRHGISEGVTDIPPGTSFPLESNLVYLSGVCFHKGCYIGQELTARTFHTGVTRKRLMPLQFDCVPKGLSPGNNIVNQNGKSVGKFRNSEGKYGLGLLRVADINGPLTITNTDGQTYNVISEPPSWWPRDDDKGYL